MDEGEGRRRGRGPDVDPERGADDREPKVGEAKPRSPLVMLGLLLAVTVLAAIAVRMSHVGCIASPEAERTLSLLARDGPKDKELERLKVQVKDLQRKLDEAEQALAMTDPLSPFGKKQAGQDTAPAAPGQGSVGGCHITTDRLPLVSDARDWSQSPKTAPTFVELYRAVHNVDWTKDGNLFKTFANPYHKTAHFNYPHSSMWLEGDKVMATVFQELAAMNQKLKFIVEAGSMHGGSAIRMAMELDKRNMKNVPILCVDPWTGDLNMWLNRIVWDMLDPRDGRATTYDQFVLNVANSIQTGRISDKHIVPFPVSSIIGARWLQATGYTPTLIYLDSAHEIDETYYELTLYWGLVAPGGILMGDDLGWPAVQKDVTRFAKEYNLELKMFGVYYNWYIIKPVDYVMPKLFS